MEFGQKFFIDCRFWDDQIDIRPKRKSIVFSTDRVMNGTPEIRPVAKRRVMKCLIRDAVVGIGLYQGVEFLFSHSSWELVFKVRTGLMRLYLAWKLTRSSQTYQMTFSGDIEENARVLNTFLKTIPG